MAKEEVIDILKKYLVVIRSEGITIDKAYLYGSYLTNSATKDSDIDIMIVTEKEDDYLAGKVWQFNAED